MASDEFDALIKLLRATSAEAVPAAENAAAEVYRNAAAAAAPRRTGQLAASVKIIEGKPAKTLMGDTRRRLFVGPEKRKGYYGYWGEMGRKGFELKSKKEKDFALDRADYREGCICPESQCRPTAEASLV